MSEQENEHDCEAAGCNNIVVASQITVSEGFDQDGVPQVWVSYPPGGSMTTILGMLEIAKAQILAEAYAP